MSIDDDDRSGHFITSTKITLQKYVNSSRMIVVSSKSHLKKEKMK